MRPSREQRQQFNAAKIIFNGFRLPELRPQVHLFCEAFKTAAAARPGAYPRRLRCASLARLPALCQTAGQAAVLSLFPDLDRVQLGPLALDLDGLRSGRTTQLVISAERLADALPVRDVVAPDRLERADAEAAEALRQDAARQAAARHAIRLQTRGCGRLVAAAVDCAKALTVVDARGLDLGEAAADVAAAARRHAGLRSLNGVAFAKIEAGTRIDLRARRIGDVGALALGRELERSRRVIDELDLRQCALSPVGVRRPRGNRPLRKYPPAAETPPRNIHAAPAASLRYVYLRRSGATVVILSALPAARPGTAETGARSPARPRRSLLALVGRDGVLAVLLRAVGQLRLEAEADAQVARQLLARGGFPRIVVVEQAPPFRNQGQEAAARRVVLRVRDDVVRDVLDPRREERDLHLGGPAVRLVARERALVGRALLEHGRARRLRPLADLADVGA